MTLLDRAFRGREAAGQLVLFAEPRARRTDPSTSTQAAQAQRSQGVEADILTVVAFYGPATDDEIAARIPRHAPTVKTARSRLTKRGLLAPTGDTRPSTLGRAQQIWRLS